MADKPQISIGIDLEQVKKLADQAAKIVSERFKRVLGQPQAGGGLPIPVPKALPASQLVPKLPAAAQKKGGYFETLMFGERGQAASMRGVRSSIAEIGDTLANNLGANRIGLGNAGSKVQGFGLIGGAGVLAGGVMAAGLAGALMQGRKTEQGTMALAPSMGGRGARQALMAGRGMMFDDQETIGYASSLSRAGASGGLRQVLRGQRAFGVGGELSELLGGQAQRGGAVTNRSAQRELALAIGTATATKLDRGRFGELIHGAAQMMGARGIGQGINTGSLYGTLGALGGRFRGAEGIQAAQGLESAFRNPTTQLGRNIALRTAGLGGRLGGDVFGAERQMELGFFGQSGGRKGLGMQGINSMLSGYRQAFGFGANQEVGTRMADENQEIQRGAMIKEMSSNMGISQNAAEQIVQAIEEGKGEADVKKLMEEGKPLQDRAYQAMVNLGTFKGLEKTFERSFQQLMDALTPAVTALVPLIEKLLEWLTSSGVAGIKNATEGFKTLASKGGIAKVAGALPGAISQFVEQTGSDVENRKELVGLAKGESGTNVLSKLDRMKSIGAIGGADYKKAHAAMQGLMEAEAMPAGAKRDRAEGAVFSKLDSSSLRELAAIIHAAIKPPVVHVHNAPGLKADAHKIYKDGTQGTALAAATSK
jgi:hypothetical protein